MNGMNCSEKWKKNVYNYCLISFYNVHQRAFFWTDSFHFILNDLVNCINCTLGYDAHISFPLTYLREFGAFMLILISVAFVHVVIYGPIFGVDLHALKYKDYNEYLVEVFDKIFYYSM